MRCLTVCKRTAWSWQNYHRSCRISKEAQDGSKYLCSGSKMPSLECDSVLYWGTRLQVSVYEQRPSKHFWRGSWRSVRICMSVPGILNGTSAEFGWAPSTVDEYPVNTANGIQRTVQLIPMWTPTFDCLNGSLDSIDSHGSILLPLQINQEVCFWYKTVNRESSCNNSAVQSSERTSKNNNLLNH